MTQPKSTFSRELKQLLSRKTTVLAVGDIHGCEKALESMLMFLTYTQAPVVFLGDYVDRGSSSVNVMDMLIEAREGFPAWTFLRGNHEQMLLDFSDKYRGLQETEYEDSWKEYTARFGGLSSSHARFIGSMPFWARLGELVFVHGGISGRFAEMPIQFHPPESLMWSRGVSPKWSGPMVVSGHTIVAEPTVDGKQILLDTGCFEGRWLTCGILNRRTGALCAALQISMDGKDFQEWWPN